MDWVDWLPIVFFPLKILVLGTGMSSSSSGITIRLEKSDETGEPQVRFLTHAPQSRTLQRRRIFQIVRESSLIGVVEVKLLPI